jgi:FtsH-binding integral membrane protein
MATAYQPRSKDDGFNVAALFKAADLSPHQQSHLTRVYAALGVCCMLAASGVYTHMNNWFLLQGGIISTILSVILLAALKLSNRSKENEAKRSAYLAGFAFCTGLNLGPLVEHTVAYHPGLVGIALSTTAVVFGSFSIASLFAQRRHMLYVTAVLSSALSVYFWMHMALLFFRTPATYTAELYLGLGIFCLYVVYDTQLILARVDMGIEDVPNDCVELFLDAVNIFIRILAILRNSSDKKKDKKERRYSAY